MKFYIYVKRRMPSKQTIMRINLTCLFLMLSLIQVSASTFGQNITLSKSNITLRELFKAIKIQSGYDAIYEPQELKKAKLVTINVTNADLKKVLDDVFATQPLTYAIDQKTIVIRKKDKSFFESIAPFVLAIDIKGKVVDEKGLPLASATIRIKGGKSVNSNERGEFELKGISQGTVLVVSYLGYKTQEITVGPSPDITIRMEISSAILDEVNVTVVNTGYQTLPKERATGSFKVISGEQLDKPTANIGQRLIGTTAGLSVVDMDANGNPTFQIRGLSSLGVPTTPLIVVDGFPITGQFNTINPNDVETITILKDAAASSIWGARAANGVIVVTTKKAKKDGGMKVDFSAFTGISSKMDLDYVNPLATSAETVDYEIKSYQNWSGLTNTGSVQSNAGTASSLATIALSEYSLGFITLAQRDALLESYRKLSNKDQIRDELLANPKLQQYNLSISGGSAKMRNNISVLYEDQQSNFKGSSNKKYTANYRMTADFFKWMEFDFAGLFNYNKVNTNGVTLGEIQGMSPYAMLRNDDGSLTDINRYYTPIIKRFVPTQLFPYADWTYNPISEIANRDNNTEQLNTRLQSGLRLKLLPGLSVYSSIQYELFNTQTRNINNENTFAVRSAVNQAATWNQTTNAITLNLPKGGTLTQNRSKFTSYIFRNSINYDRKFNDKHEISFVGGSELQQDINQTFSNPTAYGYNDNTLTVGTFPRGPGGTFFPITNWLGTAQTFSYTNSFTYGTDRFFSLFGLASYTFNSKYTLSGSLRTNASNLITDDPSYRYEPFWSTGLKWEASKENFLQNISWINRLALRATFGYGGNIDKTTSFRPLIALGTTPNLYTNDLTATISSFGNPTLRWEKTGQLNLAVDYTLFNGKLFGNIEYYNKKGKDLIASLSIPAINGTTSQKLNNAALTNQGINLEIGTSQKLANKISWTGNLTFDYNRNEITKLFIANYAASTLVGGGTGAYVVGEDANSLWRFRYAGLVNTQPTVQGPSGIQYDFGAFTPGDGRTYLANMGTSVAPYGLNLISSFQIYDFNFSFVTMGRFGHKFQRLGFNYPANWLGKILPNNKLTEVTNGDPSKIVPLPLNLIEPRYYFWDRFHQNLDYLIEDASHVRLQEVNLSYNIPARLSSKLNVRRMRVYVQGNDLYTWTANKAGEDPEYQMGTLKPQPRITLGINFDF